MYIFINRHTYIRTCACVCASATYTCNSLRFSSIGNVNSLLFTNSLFLYLSLSL